MKVYLDNQPLASPVEGLADLTVTYTRTPNGNRPPKAVSGELVFYGDGYHLLKAALVDPPDERRRFSPGMSQAYRSLLWQRQHRRLQAGGICWRHILQERGTTMSLLPMYFSSAVN